MTNNAREKTDKIDNSLEAVISHVGSAFLANKVMTSLSGRR
jgi:hypothetical protein